MLLHQLVVVLSHLLGHDAHFGNQIAALIKDVGIMRSRKYCCRTQRLVDMSHCSRERSPLILLILAVNFDLLVPGDLLTIGNSEISNSMKLNVVLAHLDWDNC